MRYAEVAVDFPGSRSTFCYSIPPQKNISAGQAVWVPFGTRIAQGIVTELSDHPSVEVTKEINSLITSYPLLSSIQIRPVVPDPAKKSKTIEPGYDNPLTNLLISLIGFCVG